MRGRPFILLFTLLMISNLGLASDQTNWPQFRGPGGLGIAEDGYKLPVEFDQSNNMIWKSAVSTGNSSLCVWGDRIFLTGLSENKLETICLDRSTGKILWTQSVTPEKLERVHPINSPATPTPTTDGERVFVYFGSYGLLCYDFEGLEKWTRTLPPPQSMYGTAASPIIAGDYLIFCNDQKTGSYLEALDPESGKTVWKTPREKFP
ncbi:MAG: PQQ-like beta-propeller repeat protein, partial [Candidatus Aminicenantes bacterium]|nr:PQQ-like beta-propeller repeat protein [Candidatus Aminicenantes bacterium]